MYTQDSMQQRLIDMAEEDGAFRERLLADPRTAIRDALEFELPADFNVVVHEDGVRTANLVLPPSAELTDAQLDQVTGGVICTNWKP